MVRGKQKQNGPLARGPFAFELFLSNSGPKGDPGGGDGRLLLFH